MLWNSLIALRKHRHRDSASAPTSKRPLERTPLLHPIPTPSAADPNPSVAQPGQLNSPFDGVKSLAVKIGQIQTATGGTIKQDSCGMA